MPRFVILEHDQHQSVHWDFMLESGDVLRSWRLQTQPVQNSSVAAAALPDHRRPYLEYEGEISGGRGHVVRWDAGEFEWIADQPQSVQLAIHGRRISGRVHLFEGESGNWTFRLTPLEPDSREPAV